MDISDIAALTLVMPCSPSSGQPMRCRWPGPLVKGGLAGTGNHSRTTAALEALRGIVAEVSGVVAGVGSVLDPDQLD